MGEYQVNIRILDLLKREVWRAVGPPSILYFRRVRAEAPPSPGGKEDLWGRLHLPHAPLCGRQLQAEHQPRIAAITASVSAKFASTMSAPCVCSVSAEKGPVATAMVRAPAACPQSISWGVSPITTTSAPAK